MAMKSLIVIVASLMFLPGVVLSNCNSCGLVKDGSCPVKCEAGKNDAKKNVKLKVKKIVKKVKKTAKPAMAPADAGKNTK